MDNLIKVLYISYDGMTDPLGQSQVIPYMEGLSKFGFEIHLLSCEKPERFEIGFVQIDEKLKQSNIHWHPIPYTSSPPVFSTLKDISKLKKEALKLHKEQQFRLVHCRSYIAAFVGLYLKKKENVPFIFDMRGFWADERVDGKIWNLRNPVFYFIYKYFKKKEKEFLLQAGHVVTLTENARKELQENFGLKAIPEISVIPCCVDNELFSRDNISVEKAAELREALNIKASDFIISYSGSIGTWYMLDEMLDFFVTLQKLKPESKFLFITPDNPEIINSLCKLKNITPDKVIICKASRLEMPLYLSLSNISLFFIKPAYSKRASSPTKMGELMSMGIPFISNSGVGDIDSLVEENEVGILIRNQTEADYIEVIKMIPDLLKKNSETFQRIAKTKYSLETGVAAYQQIYNKLK